MRTELYTGTHTDAAAVRDEPFRSAIDHLQVIRVEKPRLLRGTPAANVAVVGELAPRNAAQVVAQLVREWGDFQPVAMTTHVRSQKAHAVARKGLDQEASSHHNVVAAPG